MNPRRPLSTPVKWYGQAVTVAAAILALGAPALYAAPRTSAKSHAAEADSTPAPEKAQTPKDLLLSPDEEKKADALATFIQGVMAEDNADVDGALDAYRKVLTTDPGAKVRSEDSDHYMLLSAKVGFELARGGDPAAGIDLLKDSIKANPKDPMGYFFLSQLYSKFLKKYDIALGYAQQALDLNPDDFNFYVANYELLLELGQTKKAADILDRATKMKNDDPAYWLQLAELYIHATVKDDQLVAPADLQKIKGLFQRALDIVNAHPDIYTGQAANVHEKVADCYALMKQLKDAIPLYEKALELQHFTTDPALGSVREKLATCYVATGQRDKAIATLQDLIKDNPLNYSAYKTLAELYVKEQNFERALPNYQQVLLLNPKDWRNYIPVMELMLQLRKADQAVDVMRDAHSKFPEIPLLTYQLARALSGAKKHDEAMKTFEQAQAEAQSAESDLLDADFYFNYAAAAEQAGQYQKATELFNKTIKMDPKGKTLASPGAAYNYLGFMWVDHDQNVDAGGELIKRALQLEPDNPAYVDSLGWYYFKKGQADKALEQLLKAAEGTKPEDPEVFDHIAQTYQKLGNIPQALNYWQKALALDPDNKDELTKRMEAAKVKVTSLPTPMAEKKPDSH